jgi:hypothetical protein
MPEDATYRIVLGSRWNNLDGTVAADFLRYFLLPRRDTDSISAPWVFCYACDRSELDGFEELSKGRDRIRFGRIRG